MTDHLPTISATAYKVRLDQERLENQLREAHSTGDYSLRQLGAAAGISHTEVGRIVRDMKPWSGMPAWASWGQAEVKAPFANVHNMLLEGKHLLVCGTAGVGKINLIQNWIKQAQEQSGGELSVSSFRLPTITRTPIDLDGATSPLPVSDDTYVIGEELDRDHGRGYASAGYLLVPATGRGCGTIATCNHVSAELIRDMLTHPGVRDWAKLLHAVLVLDTGEVIKGAELDMLRKR